MDKCEHTYLYQESIRKNYRNGRNSTIYKKTDIYYCTKCLQQVEKIKQLDVMDNDQIPCWY